MVAKSDQTLLALIAENRPDLSKAEVNVLLDEVVTEVQIGGAVLLSTESVAKIIGVSVPAVRQYLYLSRKRNESGEVKPGDIPIPSTLIGNRPFWTVEEIVDWIARRPGQGSRVDLKADKD